MEILSYYQYVSRRLSYNTKLKVRRILPIFLKRTGSMQSSEILYKTALDVLKPQFPSITARESNVLAFYLSSLASISEGGNTGRTDEISEMNALRLQMSMDRRSKFISILSNIMKKISSTQNTIVQNIK